MSKFDDIKGQAADFIKEIKSRFSKNKLSEDGTSAEFQMESDDKTKEVKVADLNGNRSLYIRIFVVLTIAYLFYDEFMNKDEEVITPPPAKNRAARKRKIEQPPKPQDLEGTRETERPLEAEESNSEQRVEEVVEEISDTRSQVDESIPPDFPDKVLEESDDDQIEVAGTITEPKEEDANLPVIEEEEVIPLGEQTQNSNSAQEGVAAGKIDEQAELIKNLNSKTPDIDLSQKLEITKELEYVSPPSYNRLGRGLVYNCLKKHWACVDQFSYLTCRENDVWNNKKNKTSECVIEKVYASEKDCNTMQLYYINTNKVVEECKTD